jgi:hypothetical protein
MASGVSLGDAYRSTHNQTFFVMTTAPASMVRTRTKKLSQ